MRKLKNWEWLAIIVIAVFVIIKLPNGFLGSALNPDTREQALPTSSINTLYDKNGNPVDIIINKPTIFSLIKPQAIIFLGGSSTFDIGSKQNINFYTEVAGCSMSSTDPQFNELAKLKIKITGISVTYSDELPSIEVPAYPCSRLDYTISFTPPLQNGQYEMKAIITTNSGAHSLDPLNAETASFSVGGLLDCPADTCDSWQTTLTESWGSRQIRDCYSYGSPPTCSQTLNTEDRIVCKTGYHTEGLLCVADVVDVVPRPAPTPTPPPTPTAGCSSDADCVGQTSPSTGNLVPICQIVIDPTTKEDSGSGQCAASYFQIYNLESFWGKNVVSNTKPEFKFYMRNVAHSIASTNVEMAYYSTINSVGSQIADTAGSENIFSLLGFSRINSIPSCEVSEDFVASAKLDDVDSLQEAAFALNPKVPTPTSKLANGESNWNPAGDYWLVAGTYTECGTPWTQIVATQVKIINSECTVDYGEAGVLGDQAIGAGCTSENPYCRFGICRTKEEVSRTLTGETLPEGCILGEGGVYTGSSCGEKNVDKNGNVCPAIGGIGSSACIPEGCKYSSVKVGIASFEGECCPGLIKTQASQLGGFLGGVSTGTCEKPTFWNTLMTLYNKFTIWVWVVGIFLVLIIVLRFSKKSVTGGLGSLFR